MGIENVHPEYANNCKTWELLRDIYNNEYKKHILPCKVWNDWPLVNATTAKATTTKNMIYAERARFANYTLATLNGLLGVALAEKYILEVPPQLEYLEDNATGNRLNLEQLVRKVLTELLMIGRCGLFVDMPSVSLGMTGEETKIVNPQAKMYVYEAENIRSWDTTEINGIDELGFLVLRELKRMRINEYDWKDEFQYRVLKLNDNLDFEVVLKDKSNKDVIAPIVPKANNKTLKTIPFFIGGAEDNDWTIDKSPLWSIAHVNIGHVRNSASYEANLNEHGSGTLAITSDLNKDEWKRANPGKKLELGAGNGYFLGKQGSMTLCQLQATPETAKAMTQKEEQMLMLGADIIKPGASNSPVETAKMNLGAKVSKLETVVANAEDMIRNAIKQCAIYMGADPEKVVFNLSHKFVQEIFDAIKAREVASWWVQGLISKSIAREYARSVDLIPSDKKDEEIDAEIAKEEPVNVGGDPLNPSQNNGNVDNNQQQDNNNQ